MTTSPTTSLGSLLNNILTVVKDDTITGTLPAVNAFLQSVQANSSVENTTAQLLAFMVQLPATAPNVEAAIIKDVAGILQAEIDALAAQATAATAPKPAAT
jgi:hypothetical protein